MPARVSVRVFHGPLPGLGQDVTGHTLRFKQADNDAQDDQGPVLVPPQGYAYSWRKSLKLVCETPPDNRVFNLRFFSNGLGLGAERDVLFATAPDYAPASEADETAPIGTEQIETRTVGDPEVLQPGLLFAAMDSTPTDGGARQPFVLLQLRVGTQAVQGDGQGAMQLTYRYDET